jgi:histone demethylase JARID1
LWITFIILIIKVLKQGDFDSKASPHIKKEMRRIYTNEKSWRERIWRSGIIKSSPMPLRKCPEYVGTEEVILYLMHSYIFVFEASH